MGRNQRKWRNILLDLNFQLSFTLLLVGLAALLMALLGFWVKDVAYESTLVGVNQLEPSCADLEDAVNNPATPVVAAPVPVAPLPASDKPDKPDQPDRPDKPDEADAPANANDEKVDGEPPVAPKDDDADADEDRPASKVIIEDTHMEMVPEAAAPKPPVLVADPKIVADLERCKARKKERIGALWSSYRLILIVLFGASIFLVLGLAIHGLRMTHKVAGPLFKVGLYLEKLEKGVYDQVWNLRKGDQLMEFYEHFRAAHRELTAMQADDIAVLEKVIAAADAGELESASPEVKAAIAELRELLQSKTEGLKVPEDKRG